MAGPWEKYSQQQPAAPGLVQLPPDPMEQAAQAREEARLQLAREAAARAEQEAAFRRSQADRPSLPPGYRMGAGGVAERIPGLPTTADAGAPKLSATERANAIGGYTSAQQLRSIVADLQSKYQAGPGATSGVGGVMDYLPTTANKQFDAAGNAARGIVGTALGFTGGQLNTATEAEMAIGPYLPQAGDRDEVIRDKIRRLSELAAKAEQRSVAILGGRPDANGQITPLQQGEPLAGASQGIPAPIAMAPATNGFREVPDAPASAMIDKLVRSGIPYPKAIEEFRKAFPSANPFTPEDYNAAVGYARKNPGYKGSYGAAVKSEPLNAVERGINAVGNNALGAYGVSAANALTAGTLDELSGNQERGQFTKEMLRRQNPGASLAGDITGSALGMVGVNGALRFAGGRLAGLATRAGGLGGDALYGAALGAGENNDNRMMGALTGAGAAAAGNMVGRGLVSGAGNVARGVTDQNVGYLTDRGIPLTPGQVMGGGGMFGRAARGVEDKLTSVPFLGDAISARRSQGVEAFNREAFKEALSPIGKQVEGNIGQNAIGQAQDMVGGAYGDALRGINLRADLPFVQQVAPAIRAGKANPKTGADFGQIIDGEIAPLFGPGRTLDGSGFQEAAQAAQRGASWFAKEGSPSSNAAAGNLRDVRQGLMDLANRQAPGTTEGLANANSAYRNLSILEDASLAALNGGEGAGIFTAAQLGNAMKANGKKFGGKKAAARGDMPFSELQEAGQAVLPSTVPNSGTVDRAWGSLLLPGALGGAAYGADQLEAPAPVVASLAALAALTSKPGSAAFQKMAVGRSNGLKEAGEWLLAPRRKRLGGMFGSSLLLPVITP